MLLGRVTFIFKALIENNLTIFQEEKNHTVQKRTTPIKRGVIRSEKSWKHWGTPPLGEWEGSSGWGTACTTPTYLLRAGRPGTLHRYT